MLRSGEGEPTISAFAIRDNICSEELRRRARRESDGRVSTRLIEIANALVYDRNHGILIVVWRALMRHARGDQL
jgi:hypothetical protein